MRNWSSEQLRIYEQTQAMKSPAILAEMEAKWNAQAEKKLHGEIEQWLRMKGVHAIVHSRMDKKTTQKKGVPDFLFVVLGQPYAIEVKVGSNQLTPEQDRWLDDAALDGWRCRVVRSLDELIVFLAV